MCLSGVCVFACAVACQRVFVCSLLQEHLPDCIAFARRIVVFCLLAPQHLNNCGQFRAVSSIPLPIEDEPLSEHEEPDDEFMDLLRQKEDPGGNGKAAITPIAPTPVPAQRAIKAPDSGGNGLAPLVLSPAVSGGQRAAPVSIPEALPSPLAPPVISVVPGPIPLSLLPEDSTLVELQGVRPAAAAPLAAASQAPVAQPAAP